MSVKARLRHFAGTLFRRYGYEIVDARVLYEWQLRTGQQPAFAASSPTDAARQYLRPDNRALIDLKRRYANCSVDVTTPLVWTDAHVSSDDMVRFRGENAYVWQLREKSMNPLAYTLAAYYVESIDRLGLLAKLTEDGAFGAFSMEVNGHLVSRDLLDSILEIYFLDDHIALSSKSDLRVLDIGAGYGRLAHRMTTAMTNVKEYWCADAFPASTFISDYYLKYRGIDASRAKVIPLDQFEKALQSKRVDLALNIHSFSECRPAAIEWWVAKLAAAEVKHLMIVPNAGEDRDGAELLTNDGIDFGPIVTAYGYGRKIVKPKYRDPIVQRYGVNPTYYHLFELLQ